MTARGHELPVARLAQLPKIVGVLNLTTDSFSDGGRFLDPSAAIDHAAQLRKDGADIIDVGAQSTHPDSHDVSADEQLRRLTPVVRALHDADLVVSVDADLPAVLAEMVKLDVALINDVTALRDPAARAVVRDARCRLVLMHSLAPTARAMPGDSPPDTIVARVRTFFETRLAELADAGIAAERCILDPGLGFFVGRDPRVSYRLLRELPALQGLGRPLYIGASRKSFIGAAIADGPAPRPVDQRQFGTVACELWAALHGAAYIRTHDPAALRDALRMWRALETG